jgi:hypothetical protein
MLNDFWLTKKQQEVSALQSLFDKLPFKKQNEDFNLQRYLKRQSICETSNFDAIID